MPLDARVHASLVMELEDLDFIIEMLDVDDLHVDRVLACARNVIVACGALSAAATHYGCEF